MTDNSANTDNNINRRVDAVQAASEKAAAKAAAPASSAPRKSLAELHADKDAARLALAQTLDAIEDKVNLPKQAKLAVGRIGTGLRKTGEEQPLVLLGVALGVAGLIGAGVWWLVSRFTRG